MANAIVGSGKLLLLATLIGVPIGFLGGVYLAEFGRGAFPSLVRYTTDLLNGVPSIVIGIFAYAMVVQRMHHFSALAGGLALGVMMIPIALRTTEEFLRSVPQSLREGAMALGASKSRTIATVVIPAAIQGILSGYDAGSGAGGGRNRATAVHQLQQSLLEPGMEPADRGLARHDLYVRDLRLMRTGTGRPGPPDLYCSVLYSSSTSSHG